MLTQLRTERLVLRPVRASDAVPLMDIFGDPRLMALFDRGPFDAGEMEAWIAHHLAHRERHGYGMFTLVERASGEVIGDCGLERIELDGTEAVELGYDLRRDRWGHGLATEAASAVSRYASDELGLRRLVSLVRVGNDRSARVAARIGMAKLADMVRNGVDYELSPSTSRRTRRLEGPGAFRYTRARPTTHHASVNFVGRLSRW